MNKEERIKLRDEIFKECIAKKYIRLTKGNYAFNGRHNIKEEILKEENIELGKKYNLYINEFRSEREAKHCILHSDDYTNHICKCGKICSYYNNKCKSFYRTTCGDKDCKLENSKSEESIEKRKRTNIERYGVECNLQNTDCMKKSKSTMLEKYGTINVMKVDFIREKFTNTMKERYGVEHALQHEGFKEKFKETSKDHYGVDHPCKSEKVMEKTKATNKSKLGVEYPMQSNIVKEKSKETCLEKYGVEYSLQSKEVREKIKKTNLEKYGIENPICSEHIQEKMKNNYIEKYGVDNPSKSKKIKEKIIQSNLDKYGVEHPMKLNTVKFKLRETNLKKYGSEYYSQKDIINYDIWIDNDKFKEFIISEYKKKGTLLRLNNISHRFNVIPQSIKNKIDSLNLLEYFYIPESNLEIDFCKFLDDCNVNYTRYNHILYDVNTLGYKEIDFLLKDYNIGFEINDIGTHNSLDENSKFYKNPGYHMKKTILAKEKNIRLIHIWEWEMRNEIEWNRISNWIKYDLLIKNKIIIDAKKCNINYIKLNDEINFFEMYNINGYKKSDIAIGLYYKNKLIQAISLKKVIIDNKVSFEIIRYSTKYGYGVINGIKTIIDMLLSFNINSIIAYCDMSKNNNKEYEDLGFKIDDINNSNITWCNDNMEYFTENVTSENRYRQLVNSNYIPIQTCDIYKYIYLK